MRAKRSTHCSDGARRACADPTIRMMWASVVSDAGLVHSISSAPSPLIVPAKTVSPGPLPTGRLSPVMGAWLTPLVPRATRPSSGIRSPGLTTTIDPTATSCGRTSSSVPSGLSSRAVGGARSMSAATARRARPRLQDSSASERANRNVTVAASNHSPIPIAPSTATVISRFMSGRRRRAASQALGAMCHAPAMMPAP